MNTKELHNLVRKVIPQIKKELQSSCNSSNKYLNSLNYQQLSVAVGNIISKELMRN